MKLQVLRYFSVLAEELHFGRAADRLAITQPPLSLAIKALEEELGVQLLVRSSKHVALTPAGSAFLEEARQILERVSRASSVALAVAGGSRGRLELGMAGSLVYRGVPRALRALQRRLRDRAGAAGVESAAQQFGARTLRRERRRDHRSPARRAAPQRHTHGAPNTRGAATTAPPTLGEAAMKLLTWNTQWCCGLDGLVSPKRIVDGARAMADFDVLCLQEIACGFDAMPGQPGDQPAELQALLPGFRLFYGAAVDEFAPDGTRMRFGNLIATRLPVSRVQHHPLPWPPDPTVSSMPRMCTAVTLSSPELGTLRVMTTHLEYYATAQRLAQARALRALHLEACAQAAAPPLDPGEAGPFQPKRHTPQAILCGDFNMASSDPAYDEIVQPFTDPALPAGGTPARRLQDTWPLAHPERPQDPTFRLFDRRYGRDPIACDFVFVSDALAPRVRKIEVDLHTRASDHQPVLVELGD